MSVLGLNKRLQKLLLNLDPKAAAFDSFFSDFIHSPLSSFYKDFHQTSVASYNLMGRAELRWIKDHFTEVQGSILEFGCGLSPIAEELKEREHTCNYLGIDFSKTAIEYMGQKYPNLNWQHSHFSFLEISPFDYGLSIDSSYDRLNFKTIANRCNNRFVVSRIHPPGTTLPELRGHSKKEIDFTADYTALIIAWNEFLIQSNFERPELKSTPSWKVIYPEMKRHLEQLNQHNTMRTVTIYEKNI